MKYPYFLIFTIIVIMISCKDDAEHELVNKYPQLATGRVTELNNSGVTFVGILDRTGNNTIVDHGFIWGMVESYTPDIRKESLGKLEKDGNFTSRITTDVKPGTRYYVKAYVATADYMAYGDTVSFVSQGSSAPVVDRVVPSVVSIYSEYIVIYGKNFCSNIYDAKLISGGEVRSVSPDSVIVRVYQSNVGTNYLRLKIFDKEVTVPYIAEPITIESVTPQPAPIQTVVTVKGRHLSYIQGLCITDKNNNDTYVEILQRNDTEIQIKVPVRENGRLDLRFYDTYYYPRTPVIIFPIEITSPWKRCQWPFSVPLGKYHEYQGNLYVLKNYILYKLNVRNQELTQITELPRKPSLNYNILDFIHGNKMYFCIPSPQHAFMCYDMTTGAWEELTPADISYPGHFGFVIGNNAYVCFTDASVWVYNFQTYTWAMLQNTDTWDYRSAAVVGDKAYLISYNHIDQYDPTTGLLERKLNWPNSVQFSGVDHQKIYMDNYEYDTVTNQLKEIPKLEYTFSAIYASFIFDGEFYHVFDYGQRVSAVNIAELHLY